MVTDLPFCAFNCQFCCMFVPVRSALDPADSACEHSASSFSPDAQPFTPKTSSGMSSVVTDEPAVSGKTADHVLSPNAPEFVPKNFKPVSKVLSLDYICLKCHYLLLVYILVHVNFSCNRNIPSITST